MSSQGQLYDTGSVRCIERDALLEYNQQEAAEACGTGVSAAESLSFHPVYCLCFILFPPYINERLLKVGGFILFLLLI